MSFLSRIFGGSAPQIQQPVSSGITNPTGFNVTPGGTVSNSPTLSSNIGSLSNTFGQAATAFGNLGQTVAPGFSQLRSAGLTDIANQYMAQRSNLQQSLAQRRVLGSSFGNSQFNQLASQEATDKANFEANAYLQEFQAYNQTLQEQFTAQTQQYSTAIGQSNIEDSTAAALTATNNQIASQIAQANAELQVQNSAGIGSFIGSLLGLGLPGTSSTGGTTGGTLGGNLLSGIGTGFSNAASSLSQVLAGGSGGGVFSTGAPAIAQAPSLFSSAYPNQS